jgi:hypothetical protein
MASILQSVLIPNRIPYQKIRLGRNMDGGYIGFHHRLDSIDAVYSYGINNDISFENDLLSYTKSPIFMYDHTILDIPYHHEQFHFKKEEGNTENVIKHINDTFPLSNKLLLKMDIEGSEWDLLESINELILTRFEQMIIEFHNLAFLQNVFFSQFNITYNKMLHVFSKINKHFYLGHIHGNNCGGFQEIPNTIECTYIRKDLIEEKPLIETEAYPIPELDYPNNSNLPDYRLDWWLR